MSDGFIEITVQRRRRGRPSQRKSTRVRLCDGTRLEFGDQVPQALMVAVIEAVLGQERQVSTC